MELDIFKIFSEREYAEFWKYLLTVILDGFWIRFFAFVFLAIGLWLLIKRRSIYVGMTFVFLALTLTYGYGIIKFILER